MRQNENWGLIPVLILIDRRGIMLRKSQVLRNQYKLALFLMLMLPIVLAVHAAVAGENAVSRTEQLQVGSIFQDCPSCPQMTVVPAGQFLMGSSDDEIQRDLQEVPERFRKSIPLLSFILPHAEDTMAHEQPRHIVSIEKPFAVGIYPVTKAEYEAFIKDSGHRPENGCSGYQNRRYVDLPAANWKNPGFVQTDRDPVVCVSYFDAHEYIKWLNSKVFGGSQSKTGAHYYLPSEAEWEYVARAGTRTARPWGQGMGINNANCRNCGNVWDGKGTSPVGSFQANSFGLYDVLGNVFEWTNDCWNASYKNASATGMPSRDGSCSTIVVRGGSWFSSSDVLMSATRFRGIPAKRDNQTGLRVMRSIE